MAQLSPMSDIPPRETLRLIASDKVEGTPVFNPDGERLGHINTLMVDKLTGKVDFAVLQFGGFLGIGSDYYPLPWGRLEYSETLGGYLLNITRAELEGAPHYVEEAPEFDRAYDRRVLDYYQVPHIGL